mmetsp:Transcript_59383/g.98433  ORF Transcript_59383/g.98433 Transcript_59383/m.98433 type:complete len:450 (+) Transcript_59383:90-1439(+)|eukprot:CAMPEP_0119311808 /NCGR_PEP_ID=MMETSP1333-20130426/23919_1 /TAXON_ID=418940 /ORGANISM="Scyphosphaera apsteinii, Strain RCC1455" /LENGTH=449 /DNA_ID=CAMNT_0007316283 /DNA_START=157 /DNA_END=1506 /DNA_ORIENTATION=-
MCEVAQPFCLQTVPKTLLINITDFDTGKQVTIPCCRGDAISPLVQALKSAAAAVIENVADSHFMVVDAALDLQLEPTVQEQLSEKLPSSTALEHMQRQLGVKASKLFPLNVPPLQPIADQQQLASWNALLQQADELQQKQNQPSRLAKRPSRTSDRHPCRRRRRRPQKLPPPRLCLTWRQPQFQAGGVGTSRSRRVARRAAVRMAEEAAAEAVLEQLLHEAVASAATERAAELERVLQREQAVEVERLAALTNEKSAITIQAATRRFHAVAHVNSVRIQWDKWAAEHVDTCECGSDDNIRCFCGCVLCASCHFVAGSLCPGSDNLEGCGADAVLTITTHLRKLTTAYDTIDGASDCSLNDCESSNESVEELSDCDSEVCAFISYDLDPGKVSRRSRRSYKHQPRAREVARFAEMANGRIAQQVQKRARALARDLKFSTLPTDVVLCFNG